MCVFSFWCVLCSFCVFRLPMLGLEKAQYRVTVSSRLALAYIGTTLYKTMTPTISYLIFCVVWSVAEPEVARGRDHSYNNVFSYWGRSQIRRFREWKWLKNRRPTLHLCEESIQRSTSPSLPIEPSISRVTHALKSKARNATRSPMAHSKVGSVNASATHLTFSFT